MFLVFLCNDIVLLCPLANVCVGHVAIWSCRCHRSPVHNNGHSFGVGDFWAKHLDDQGKRGGYFFFAHFYFTDFAAAVGAGCCFFINLLCSAQVKGFYCLGCEQQWILKSIGWKVFSYCVLVLVFFFYGSMRIFGTINDASILCICMVIYIQTHNSD